MKTVKNKFRICLLIAALVLSATSFAQPQGGPPPIPSSKQIKKMVSEMSTTLSLSDEQNDQILKLYTDHFTLVEEKQNEGRPQRSEMEALQTTLDSNVKKLLNSEQSKAYDNYMETKKSERKGRGPKR